MREEIQRCIFTGGGGGGGGSRQICERVREGIQRCIFTGGGGLVRSVKE